MRGQQDCLHVPVYANHEGRGDWYLGRGWMAGQRHRGH